MLWCMSTAWLWKGNEGFEGSLDISSCYKIRVTFATPFRFSCFWITRCSSRKGHFPSSAHPQETTEVLCRTYYTSRPRRAVKRSFMTVLGAGKNYRQEGSARYFWSSSAILRGSGLSAAHAASVAVSPAPLLFPGKQSWAWQQRVPEASASRNLWDWATVEWIQRNGLSFVCKICCVSFMYNQILTFTKLLITGREV